MPDETPAAHPDAELGDSVVRELHALLVAERERLEGILATSRDARASSGQVFADDADAAIHERDVADLVSAAARRMQRLEDVNDALERLTHGTYGLCEASDEPIGIQRLRAAPWARFAVTHQEEMERRSAQRARRGS